MKHSFLIILLGCIALTSCDSNKIYEKYESIPGAVWASDQPVNFEVDIQDTVSLCNIIINVRNADSYPFRNLFLEFTSDYPNEQTAVDTLEFYLMRADGKPLGKCAGELCDIQYQVGTNQRFKQTGLHKFTIKHIMRTADGKLPLIIDMGLRIEKSGN